MVRALQNVLHIRIFRQQITRYSDIKGNGFQVVGHETNAAAVQERVWPKCGRSGYERESDSVKW